MKCAIGLDTSVPGAMMAAPSPSPTGISPGGLPRNTSSSWSFESCVKSSGRVKDDAVARVVSIAMRDLRLAHGAELRVVCAGQSVRVAGCPALESANLGRPGALRKPDHDGALNAWTALQQQKTHACS